MHIPIHEIIRTIQGEGARAGWPCVIVRTLGCNLACRWCDTSQKGAAGVEMSIPEIAARVAGLGTRLVELTGGEPLVHADAPALCERLLAGGHEVLVETNGSLDVSVLPAGVVRIVDLKPPSSGESGRNLLSNVALLSPADEIKIVVADEADYDWARRAISGDLAGFAGPIHLSPLTPGMDPGKLARMILLDRLPVRLNLQIHKIIFPGGEKGA